MTTGAIIEAKYKRPHTLYQLEQGIVKDTPIMKMYKNGEFLGLITMREVADMINDKREA